MPETTDLTRHGWKHCPACNMFLPAQHKVTKWCDGNYETPAWTANELLNRKVEHLAAALERIRDGRGVRSGRAIAREALERCP